MIGTFWLRKRKKKKTTEGGETEEEKLDTTKEDTVKTNQATETNKDTRNTSITGSKGNEKGNVTPTK